MPVASDEFCCQPAQSEGLARKTGAAWQKLPQYRRPKFQDGFPLRKCPLEGSREELTNVETDEQVREFRDRSRHSTQEFITTKPRKDDTVSAARKKLAEAISRRASGVGRRGNHTKTIPGRFLLDERFWANVNVGTGPTAPLFHDLRVRQLVPVRFLGVEVRDGVEARSLAIASREQGVRHANNGGRIHSPA